VRLHSLKKAARWNVLSYVSVKIFTEAEKIFQYCTVKRKYLNAPSPEVNAFDADARPPPDVACAERRIKATHRAPKRRAAVCGAGAKYDKRE
jgi:hypothetical protein